MHLFDAVLQARCTARCTARRQRRDAARRNATGGTDTVLRGGASTRYWRAPSTEHRDFGFGSASGPGDRLRRVRSAPAGAAAVAEEAAQAGQEFPAAAAAADVLSSVLRSVPSSLRRPQRRLSGGPTTRPLGLRKRQTTA